VAATTRPRKSPARPAVVKSTPRSAVTAGRRDPIDVLGDNDGIEPLLFTSPDEPEVDERIVVAYLDDYPLTIPTKIPPNVALRLMRTARVNGDESAFSEMLEEVLGSEGHTALVNWRHLTPDNLTDLVKIIQRQTMGALETPKGSSRNA